MIEYLVLMFCMIGVAFVIGDCTCLSMDENRTKINKCDNDKCAKNHTFYYEQPVDSDIPGIYVWKMQMVDFYFDNNASFGLIPENCNVDLGALHDIDSNDYLQDVYMISKYIASAPQNATLSKLTEDDIITFIYDSQNGTLSFYINNNTPETIFRDISKKKGLSYKFCIFLHDNGTGVKCLAPDTIKPAPIDASYDNCWSFEFTKCFCCNETIKCTCELDIINHLFECYENFNKKWRICDETNCTKNNNKPFVSDKEFICHMLAHKGIYTYKCNVHTNDVKCNFKTIQRNNMILHGNSHYRPLTTIKPTTPKMILDPKQAEAIFDNCHLENSTCVICNKQLKTWSEYILHIKKNNCFTKNTCPNCLKSCNGPSKLLPHLSSCYGLKVYKCNVKINGHLCKKYCVNK
eukprot:280746_1